MNKWDKLLEEFVGKDKCESLDIIHNVEKDNWMYKYKEKIDGKYTIQSIILPTLQEAEKFHFTFGGKNPSSVSAPEAFLRLGQWRSGDMSEMGHKITEIVIEGMRQTRHKTLPIYLPEDTGYDRLINKKKTKTQSQAKLILTDKEICNISRVFKSQEEFDNFVDFLQNEEALSTLVFYVNTMCLENEETKKVGKWMRCRAKDGTNRMILELQQIDGEKYQDIMYSSVLAYADGMASGECRKIPKKVRSKPETVCYFAAKEGKFD
jgi:hypothetical protein